MIENTDGSTHPVIDHIFVTTKIDKDIITTAYKYINGDSQFVSFNRYVQTMKLISSIQSGSKLIDSLKEELVSRDAFVYVEYTFIPIHTLINSNFHYN